MDSMTYYVALAFTRSEGGDIVACEPKEARSSGHSFVAEVYRPCYRLITSKLRRTRTCRLFHSATMAKDSCGDA